MEGYIYFDHKEKIPGAIEEISTYIKNGSLKFREDIYEGLESAPKALQRLFLGENRGKVLVKVLHDSEDEKLYEI